MVKRKRSLPKRRSVAAKDLESPKYAHRVVPDRRRKKRETIADGEMKDRS